VTPDRIETIGRSLVQHGSFSNRIYVMKLDVRDVPPIIEDLDALAEHAGYTKLFAKIPASVEDAFLARGYRREAMIPGFFNGSDDASFLGKYLDPARAEAADPGAIAGVIESARAKMPAPGQVPDVPRLPDDLTLDRCMPEHADEMAGLYRVVFPSYPFPSTIRTTSARR
jgi:putative beta-lysine N-acetyltransferase